MVYTPTVWVDGGPPAINAANLNKIEAALAGDEHMVDGADLDATLAALPAYTPGGALRRVTVRPGTYTRTTTLTVPSGVHLSAHGCRFVSAVPGDSGCLVTVSAQTDVIIEGGVWDGAKADYAGTTQWRHNFAILASSRVRLVGLVSIAPKGDAVHIGTDATPSRDVTLDRVRCDAAHRNGLSIISVAGFRATGCEFVNTAGNHPMAGVDIEPNVATTVVDDVTFVGCRFGDNAQYGLLVASPNPPSVRQGGVTLVGCSIDGNGIAGSAGNRIGLRLHAATEFRMLGGQIRGNAEEGVRCTSASTDVQFVGVEIAANGFEGIRQTVQTVRLSLVGARVCDNSQADPGVRDGLNLEAGTGISLTGVVSTGASQRYGLRTLSGVSGLNLVGGIFSGNGTGEMSLADAAADRFRADRSGVATQGAVDSVRAGAGDTGLSARIAGDAAARFLVRGDGDIRWGDGTTAGDTRLYRSAADTLRTPDTFIADVALSTAGYLASTATNGSGYFELREQSAIPAPAGKRSRMFVQDNGAGKTQLCVRFGTGAVQILATEP